MLEKCSNTAIYMVSVPKHNIHTLFKIITFSLCDTFETYLVQIPCIF